MARRPAKKRIARSIYLTREHDDAVRALAARTATDFNKAMRAVIQRGLDAPDLPEFAVAKLAAQAATHQQTLSDYLCETVIRHALGIPRFNTPEAVNGVEQF